MQECLVCRKHSRRTYSEVSRALKQEALSVLHVCQSVTFLCTTVSDLSAGLGLVLVHYFSTSAGSETDCVYLSPAIHQKGENTT